MGSYTAAVCDIFRCRIPFFGRKARKWDYGADELPGRVDQELVCKHCVWMLASRRDIGSFISYH